jgi:hypothetical protein
MPAGRSGRKLLLAAPATKESQVQHHDRRLAGRVISRTDNKISS